MLARLTASRPVKVGVSRLPYKCPSSPLGFALLLEDWLRGRGLRSRTRLSFIYPVAALSPFPAVASWADAELRERGYEIVTGFETESVEAAPTTIRSRSGSVSCDLGVLVPPHVGAPFLGHGTIALGNRLFLRGARPTLLAHRRLLGSKRAVLAASAYSPARLHEFARDDLGRRPVRDAESHGHRNGSMVLTEDPDAGRGRAGGIGRTAAAMSPMSRQLRSAS